MTEGQNEMSRRDFLKKALNAGLALGAIGVGGGLAGTALTKSMGEAADRGHGIGNSNELNKTINPNVAENSGVAIPVQSESGESAPVGGMTTDINCAPVKEGGSVSQAISDAHGGEWPGSDQRDVKIDRPGEDNDEIKTLQQVMESSPGVNPGDEVCDGPPGIFKKDN